MGHFNKKNSYTNNSNYQTIKNNTNNNSGSNQNHGNQYYTNPNYANQYYNNQYYGNQNYGGQYNGNQFTPPENKPKLPFFQQTWFIILMMIFIAPVGIFLMWYFKEWKTMNKVIISVCLIFYFMIYCGMFS